MSSTCTKANYNASVAYVKQEQDIEVQNDPLGEDKDGNPIYLKDDLCNGI